MCVFIFNISRICTTKNVTFLSLLSNLHYPATRGLSQRKQNLSGPSHPEVNNYNFHCLGHLGTLITRAQANPMHGFSATSQPYKGCSSHVITPYKCVCSTCRYVRFVLPLCPLYYPNCRLYTVVTRFFDMAYITVDASSQGTFPATAFPRPTDSVTYHPLQSLHVN